MRIHHIGYLVKKNDKAQISFEKLGYVIKQPVVYDEYRKIDICFMEKDNYLIELVSPAASDSVVSEIIKQYRNSPYHICYASDDFDNDLTELSENGYVQIGEPNVAPAIGNKKVAFFLSPTIGMIEIVEE